MNKIFAFIIILPIIAKLLFQEVAFYEYDTKQRYIKDIVDGITYKVKITGVLTQDEYYEFREKLLSLADFKDTAQVRCIVLRKGIYSNGVVSGITDYTLGEVLNKGDAFSVYVHSSEVSNYSKLQNGGKSADDSRNIYYTAKAVCRVEYIK